MYTYVKETYTKMYTNVKETYTIKLGQPDSTPRSGGEVGGWGRDPKKCTGRDWGMGSSTI